MSYSTSCVLHKTPVTPPIAVAAKGIYFDLEDGRHIIDAVGGAAVACIGSGHPEVVAAIREQAGKVSCKLGRLFAHSVKFVLNSLYSDTFHQQLSNEPVELLARNIIENSKGAFALCGFVAGGKIMSIKPFNRLTPFVKERRRWKGQSKLQDSTSMKPVNHNERNISDVKYRTTEHRSERWASRSMVLVVLHTNQS